MYLLPRSIRWRHVISLSTLLLLLTLLAPGPAQAADDFLLTRHVVADGWDAVNVIVYDLDEDGDLDVVGAAEANDRFLWWENSAGDGTLWTEYEIDDFSNDAYDVDIADVDGDGDPDIVAAAEVDDDILWYENSQGDASTWVERTIIGNFNGATSVEPADVDGDGDVDVVAAALYDDDVAWFENTAGDGSGWAQHTIDDFFDGAYEVEAADMDDDGDIDILAAATDGDDIFWYQNLTGDGLTWQITVVSTTFDGARGIDIADVDGDGDIDVLAAAANEDDVAWFENVFGDALTWEERTVDPFFDGAWDVAFVDVDDDGDLDIVGTAINADDLAWWENVLGDASIWTERPIDTAIDGVRSVAAGDLDGDGDTDLVTAASNADRFDWWEKTIAWRRHAVTVDFDGAFSVATADIDGDGTRDVVGAAFEEDRIAFWANVAGDGNELVEYTIAGEFRGATGAYPADINGDGAVDVLGVSYADGIVAWWENAHGDGTLWRESVIASEFDGAFEAFVADVDGDGDVDVVAVARQGDEVAWFENVAGDGTIWSKRSVATAFDGASTVTAADIDDDGDMDIAATAYADSNLVWWENLDGVGGAWSARLVSGSAWGITDIVASDLDKDGDVDLLYASQTRNTLAWFENVDGAGGSWSLSNVTTALSGAIALAPADVDEDGDTDLLAAAQNSNDIVWFENVTGDGTFWFPEEVDINFTGARSVEIADMDGDGVLDFVGAATAGDSILWWKQDRAPWRTRAVAGGLPGASDIETADLDNDGDPDILASSYDRGLVGWRENLGGGLLGFSYPIAVDFDGVRDVVTADVNGDGALDVVGAASATDRVVWWSNDDGDGVSWTEFPIDEAFDGAHMVAASDVDADGDVDVLGTARWADEVAWWENLTGDGDSWAKHIIDGDFDGAASLALADIDGDGRDDVVATANSGDAVAWWRQNEDRRSWQKTLVVTGFDGAQAVVVADIDGDEDQDLVASARWLGEIRYFENVGGDGMTWSEQLLVDGYGGAFGLDVADIDNDGDPDILGTAVDLDAIDWLENQDGLGTLWKARPIARQFDGPRSVLGTDLDEDGDTDVLGAAFYGGQIASWENTAPPPPDFAIVAAPDSLNVCAPESAVYNITVRSISGYEQPVTLSTIGEPDGTSVAFSVNPVVPLGTSTMTVGDTDAAAAGSYALSIVGTAFTRTHTATVSLELFSAVPTVPLLLAPADGATNTILQPTFEWTSADQGVTYGLEVATDVEFTNLVYQVTGLDTTSHTPEIDLDTDTVYYWRVWSTNHCGDGANSAVFSFTTVPPPGVCPIGTTPQNIYSEDFEDGAFGWTHSGSGDTWELSTVRPYSGTTAYHATDVETVSDQLLFSPAIALPVSESPLTLQFWNYQDIEAQPITGCYDGAVLELSADGGTTWVPLDAELLTDPYDGIILEGGTNPLNGRKAWCGNIQDWTLSVVDLNAFAGETVQFRFRLATDLNVGFEGWYIDALNVQSCVAP